MNRRHLLILGAGASMSLVPVIDDKNNSDIYKDHRLPSGAGLVEKITQYNRTILIMFLAMKSEYKSSANFYETYSILKTFWKFNLSNKIESQGQHIHNQNNNVDFRAFKDIISKLKAKANETNTFIEMMITYSDYRHGFFVLNDPVGKSIYTLYLACYLVNKYMPLSIDYFANNLEFFTGTDINLFVELGLFNDSENAITQIQKYLKVIICEILNEKQLQTIEYAKTSSDQNYIRQIIWNMALEANREEVDVKTYIENNLDVITFNYDVTIDTLLKEYQNLSVNPQSGVFLKSNSINETQKINIIHVYSYIGAGNGQLGSLPEINLAKAILSNNSSEFENILEECNNSIFWIRNTVEDPDSKITKEKTQSLCLELIKTADNIYFLGFGFDKNNLENIGFAQPKLNEAGIKRYKGTIVGKRIFVSKTTGKINDILMQIIKSINHEYSVNNVGDDAKLNTRMGDSAVYVSDLYNQNRSTLTSFNYIDEAFERDFDI